MLICGEKIEHMPELVQEDQNLSVHRITRVRPHFYLARTMMAHGPAFLPNFNHAGHGIKKRPVCVDRDRRVPSIALKNPGDIRIPENDHATYVFGFPDKPLSLAVHFKAKRSKGASRIRILFPEPRRTGVFGLQDFENLFARPQNFLSWLPHSCQVRLHPIYRRRAPALRRA